MLAGMFVILTGDIVSSSDLSASDVDATLQAAREVAQTLQAWPGVTQCGFARRGGDAWQLAFDVPRLGLRSAVYLHASLRRLHKARASRIAIAEGAGRMPDHDPNAAHGAGFTASGRTLEGMQSTLLFDHAAGGPKAAAARLAGHIAQGWTQAQARAVAEQVQPQAGPRAEAAARLGITRQAVDQALWAAGFPVLEAALSAWERE